MIETAPDFPARPAPTLPESGFRALVEHSPDIISRFDREGRHQYVSPAVELATGRLQEDFLGRTHREVGLPDAFCEMWEAELRHVMESGQEGRLVFEFPTPLGVRTFDARLVPEVGPDRRVEAVTAVARDVTAQVEARRETERLAAERGAILRQLTEGVVVAGPDGRINYLNDAAERMLGRAVRGLPIEELSEAYHVLTLDGAPFPPESLPLVRVVREGRTAKDVVMQVERPDGSRIVLEASASPVEGEDGTLLGVVVTARDVTERRAAQMRLAAAEAHYRRLVENSPYPIYALDAGGRVRELNSAAVAALGYEVDELMGRHFADIVDPTDWPAAAASFERAMRDGGGETELRVVRKCGEQRLIHLRAAAVVEDGRVTGTHGVARDITDERARDEQIRLLATALEGLDKGVSIVDATGRFHYANSAHAKLYGYDLARLPELDARDFLPGEDRNAEFEALIERLREGTVTGRYTRRRTDGSEMSVGVVTGRMAGSGRELFVTITRDATEELRREQHMHRAERLASMGTLLSGVAHELNNPLNAIANFAQLLLMGERSGEDQEALEIMQREAERAARIVCDLRTIARQTQDAPVEKELVDLNDVVRHVLKLRRYTLETHDIRVAESLDQPLPRVWGSRPELEQVVLNLVLNAEQAMAGLSRTRRLTFRTSANRARVLLQVADTGPGIPESIVGRVFDPFFTTKAPGEGTGLGLSLVHTIVTAHGGEIRLSSTGRGTTFSVEIPRAREREVVGPPSSPIGVADRPLRLLVVDDEGAIRRSLQIYLERRGHAVTLARNGSEALERLEEPGSRYDVILSDLRMPGLGGEQLLRELQKRGSGLDRRVVFMTGDAASGDAARILEATGNPALLKPVRLDHVARVVEETERRLRESAEG